MSTVLVELDIEFANGATVSETVTAPIDLGSPLLLDDTLSVLGAMAPDLSALTSLWGPVVDLSWSVAVSAHVIPLPASGWLMAAAMAVVAFIRPRTSKRAPRQCASTGVRGWISNWRHVAQGGSG